MEEDGFSPTVSIIGLGLMGGSLALALNAAGVTRRIIGVDRDAETLAAALALNTIAEGHAAPGAFLAKADIIVLATPVRTIIQLLPVVASLARPGALILDFGSTKSEIVHAMDALPPSVHAIGGHPMCGKETSGFEVADAGLFRGRPFVLTPTTRSTDEDLAQATQLVTAVGGRVVQLEAERHDALAAAISHVPYLVAANLVLAACDWAKEDAAVWDLAASGFRDTTRLAASDTTMMLDILLTNRAAISARLRDYANGLAELAELIDGNHADISSWMRRAADARRALGGGLHG